jgi:uncharacterized cupredoxin-like copper-binding protein
VRVVARDFSFEPAEVRITASSPVNLVLANEGRVFHDLVVPALGLDLDAEPGRTDVAGLQDLPKGTYRFFCSVPGHAQMGMVGILVVQ